MGEQLDQKHSEENFNNPSLSHSYSSQDAEAARIILALRSDSSSADAKQSVLHPSPVMVNSACDRLP